MNHTQDYFKEDVSNYDIILQNIIDSSFNYSLSNIYGLNYEQIKNIISSKSDYKINLFFIIIHFSLFIIFFLFFVWIISKRYKIKKNLIQRMINFQTEEFDMYKKYLEEVSKNKILTVMKKLKFLMKIIINLKEYQMLKTIKKIY